jgi:DNA-directed RNA polymerase specialized sigma24 family protein
VELEPPTSTWEPIQSSKPMPLRADEPDHSCCPCGEELAPLLVAPVLCARHHRQIVRHVERRFGRHRYGGRYASCVEDIVQECYVKVVRPGALDSFEPRDGRSRADAFGAWLWGVVRYHCNNKLDYYRRRPDFAGEPLASLEEIDSAMTPEEAFGVQCILDHVRGAVADVKAAWKMNPTKSQRFDVFLPLVLKEGGSYKAAEAAASVSQSNARRLTHELRKQVIHALRQRVRDTLDLEPGLTQEAIRRRIDAEIKELLKASYRPTKVAPQKTESER